MTTHLILAALALLIVFWAVGAYQRLGRQRARCIAAFAKADAQLPPRHELVPRLVETAGAYMKDERGALETVIAACNEAIAAHAKAGGNAFDIRAVQRMGTAEHALETALADMFALAQRYPELQSDRNMQQLCDELQALESKIGFARQVYNEAASHYNAARAQFPSSVVAVAFAFRPVGMLLPADEAHAALHS